uniref:G_PROTEIN_RECEP_F3_4 domain-containing protein n=1 Tax=Macrostomum lignano TaxID=282301 RepID=A0A1I8I7H8_9PLAT
CALDMAALILTLLLVLAASPIGLCKKMSLPGELILGGLFPIHEKDPAETSRCGKISENRGIQRLEAMVYALNRVNADPSLLPHLKLGAKLLDTCSKDTYALEQSMDFVTDHLSTLDASYEYQCPDPAARTPKRKSRKPVAGVIGAADSSVSIMIANILRLFKLIGLALHALVMKEQEGWSSALKSRYLLANSRKGQPAARWILLTNEHRNLDFGKSEEETTGNNQYTNEATVEECCVGGASKRTGSTRHFSQLPRYCPALFQRDAIPQISYASTSPELSDNNRFDYFFRVVPPDNYQAKAMVAIVKQMNWNYVAALYDEGTYGERGFQEFKAHASQQGICISGNHMIRRNAINGSLESILSSLLEMKSRVVVTYCQAESLRLLFRLLARRQPYRRDLFWVASDGWGRKTDHLLGDEFLAEGAISLLPERRAVVDFDNYFTSLKLEEHAKVNPWWREFWQSQFHCKLDHSTGEGGGVRRNFDKSLKSCTGDERIGVTAKYEQEGLVPMVVDAVYAMAHSLHRLLCGNGPPSACRKVTGDRKLNGTQLRDLIRNISFNGTSGNLVRFNRHGDRESLYEIFQLQRVNSAESGGNQSFRYYKIGTWGDDRLELDNSSLRWGTPGEETPRSVCSEPCDYGKRTVAPNKEAAACCWECVSCDSKYQIVLNSTTCSDCPLGSIPNRYFNSCEPLPIETIQLNSVWALLPMSFSFLGLLCTAFVLFVFVKYNQTPLIRASGRELCYVMLAGILLSYCMTFIMLAPPSPVTCGFFRIFNGLSLSIIYSAIFTKTNRLSRIFNRGIKSLMKKPSYTSPKSQLVLCCCLVSVQVIGDMTWLGMDLPKTKFDYPDRDHKVLRCAVDDVAIVVSLLYNMILIVLCTLYAFKTRNIPENFNEAKYIAFTMYSTCIVWLAFIAIYFGSLRNFRIKLTSLCMCISISAAVTLGCMFAPKVYIVLFKPHKN